MGYLSSISGQLTITPPLTAKELRALPAVDGLVRVAVATEARDTDDGILTVTTGVGIELVYDDSVKAYDFETDVAQAVRMCAESGSGHTVAGVFVVDGEDQGDVWRLIVTDGQVRRENARLVWPDGEDAKPYV